jgi:uncharacterized protein YodC (DUF2158 family)
MILQQGDIVKLKSGSVRMTVNQVKPYHDAEGRTRYMAVCIYAKRNGDIIREAIDNAALEKITEFNQ